MWFLYITMLDGPRSDMVNFYVACLISLLTMLDESFTNMVKASNFDWYRFLFLTMLDILLLTWLDTVWLDYFEYVFY